MIQHISLLSEQRRKELILWHKDPEKYRPIPTGLFAIDRSGGVRTQNGSYVVILGPDKAGKSAVGVKVGLSMSVKRNTHITVYALEESKMDWVDRVISFMSNSITRTRIMNLVLVEEDFDHWARDLNPDLEQTTLHVEDQLWKAKDIIDSTIASIKEEIKTKGYKDVEEYKDKGVRRICLIDGFQLLTDFPGTDENERLTNISRLFMEARSKWGITFIVIAQLNKAGRAYGSEAVYKDANLLLELRRKRGQDGNPEVGMAQLAVLPNRQSAPYPFMDILLDGDHSRVANVGSIVLNDEGEVEPTPEEIEEARKGVVEHDFFGDDK